MVVKVLQQQGLVDVERADRDDARRDEPYGERRAQDWPGDAGEGLHFVQFISLCPIDVDQILIRGILATGGGGAAVADRDDEVARHSVGRGKFQASRSRDLIGAITPTRYMRC